MRDAAKNERAEFLKKKREKEQRSIDARLRAEEAKERREAEMAAKIEQAKKRKEERLKERATVRTGSRFLQGQERSR